MSLAGAVRAWVMVAVFVFSAPVFSSAAKEADTWDKVRSLYLKGNIYLEQKDFEGAQKQYQEALMMLYGPDFKSEDPARDLVTAMASGEPEADKKETPAEGSGRRIIRNKKTGATEYVIGQDDVLAVSVWQNPDLSQDLIVRPDGKVSFPLIGDMPAAGKTITELDKDITERLTEFVRAPEVSISIRKLGGAKVIVLGEVAHQGVVSVQGECTIIEAIGLAGGFTRDSVPSSTILIRGGFDNPQAQRLNLSKALKGMPRQNIALQAEDIIFVPKKFIADVNYFLGQVLDPLSKGLYISRELQTFGTN